MEGIRAFSSTDRSNQLQSITIMLLQEQHITTFTQAAGTVLKDIVHTAEIKQATASNKQIKLPTAATTSRDSDDEVQLDQPIGRLLPPAPVPNGDADNDFLDLDEPVRKVLPLAPVPNGDTDNDFLDLDEPVRQVLPPATIPNGKSDDPLMQICTLVRSHQHHTGSRIWSFVSRTKNSWQRGLG